MSSNRITAKQLEAYFVGEFCKVQHITPGHEHGEYFLSKQHNGYRIEQASEIGGYLTPYGETRHSTREMYQLLYFATQVKYAEPTVSITKYEVSIIGDLPGKDKSTWYTHQSEAEAAYNKAKTRRDIFQVELIRRIDWADGRTTNNILDFYEPGAEHNDNDEIPF